MKRKVILYVCLIAAWILLCGGLLLKSCRLSEAVDEMQSVQIDKVVETPEPVTELIQSPYTDLPYNYDNIKKALSNVVTDVKKQEMLAYLFTYEDVDCNSWLLHASNGFCDVYTLSINDDDTPVVTVTCYEDGNYVMYSSLSNLYYYSKDNFTFAVSPLFAESLLHLYDINCSSWDWNVTECVAAFGCITYKHPNVNQDVRDGCVVLDNGIEYTIGKAWLQSEGDVIQLYAGSVPKIVITQEVDPEWMIGDSLNYEQFVSWCEDSDFLLPAEIDTLFAEFPPRTPEYWSGEVINSVLYVYGHEAKDDGSFKSTELFHYSYQTGVFKMNY